MGVVSPRRCPALSRAQITGRLAGRPLASRPGAGPGCRPTGPLSVRTVGCCESRMAGRAEARLFESPLPSHGLWGLVPDPRSSCPSHSQDFRVTSESILSHHRVDFGSCPSRSWVMSESISGHVRVDAESRPSRF